MITLICITVLSCYLLWLSAGEKKPYHPDDMLWVMYIANREMRVKENGTS